MLKIILLISVMTSALPTAARTMTDEDHLSFLIPRGASAEDFENAVVLATPKDTGVLVRLNTYLHFVNTRSEAGDLQLIHDFHNFPLMSLSRLFVHVCDRERKGGSLSLDMYTYEWVGDREGGKRV